MALPDKRIFQQNRFLKGLREKVCEACPFIKITCKKHTKKLSYQHFHRQTAALSPNGKNTIPIPWLANRPRLGTI